MDFAKNEKKIPVIDKNLYLVGQFCSFTLKYIPIKLFYNRYEII